jgi:secondary thiamine-phosphate synthase enzyme
MSVAVMHADLTLATAGRGFYLLTPQVDTAVRKAGVGDGLCHVFLLHTSAGLLITENADPDVHLDLEAWLGRLAQDGDPRYRHRAEGPDDMSAHIRTMLTETSLLIPIRAGKLLLGTWQGLYLYEHRTGPQERHLALTMLGAGPTGGA